VVFKRFARRLGRPLAQRQIYPRIDDRMAEPLRELRERIDAVGETSAAVLDEYLPALLNSLSSQHAVMRDARRSQLELREALAELVGELATVRARVDEVQRGAGTRLDAIAGELSMRLGEVETVAGRLSERIDGVEARGEFSRNEILYELRHGARGPALEFEGEPRIVDEQKVAAADEIRLNLGCGHLPLKEYLNVDGRPLEGVDIVADVGKLPFGPGEVSEIFSAHLLEHFPVEQLRRQLLPYWRSLLEPGGTFAAVVPDPDTMFREYAAGRMPFEEVRLATFGAQEYDGDFHFTMFTSESLVQLLNEAGFAGVALRASGRRNGACYEMEIEARRPA
jgi:predicted SAM-dependent methyltransferase